MTFIVVFISSLIERFFDWSHVRHWYWYEIYQRTIVTRLAGKSPYLILAGIILPLVAGVLLLKVILTGWLYGLMQLIFQLLLVMYCLGPRNFWADAFASINILSQNDTQLAATKLKNTFGPISGHSLRSMHAQLLERIFIAGNQRFFAILFWFVVLGPIGPVIYRSTNLTANQADETEVVGVAKSLESVLDWLPMRLLTLLFAIGNRCSEVLSCWRKLAILGWNQNNVLVTNCGLTALGVEDIEKIPADGSTARRAISLLDLSFVFSLAILALAELIL